MCKGILSQVLRLFLSVLVAYKEQGRPGDFVLLSHSGILSFRNVYHAIDHLACLHLSGKVGFQQFVGVALDGATRHTALFAVKIDYLDIVLRLLCVTFGWCGVYFLTTGQHKKADQQ